MTQMRLLAGMALPDIHQICLNYCRHEAAQARPVASVNPSAWVWALRRLGQEVGGGEEKTDGDRREDKSISRVERGGRLWIYEVRDEMWKK